jgi:molybdopterin molybdotransferase
MITVDQARQKLIEAASEARLTEKVDIADALGRVVATDIVSEIDVPPQDNSAMDGFAVNTEHVRKGVSLIVSQRIAAGHKPQALSTKSAARIFTGGVLPSGANAVVIQENCEYQTDGASVVIKTDVSVGDNIRPRGQDIRYFFHW